VTARGGGPGVGETQSLAIYGCASAGCPLESRVEPYDLPWPRELEEATSPTITSKTTGVELVSGCWIGPATGPGNGSTAERNAPFGELLPFIGEWEPNEKNGSTARKPSHIEFGAGSGELINVTAGAAATAGNTTLMGYIGTEVITASAP
jgi:hypothetical protein